GAQWRVGRPSSLPDLCPAATFPLLFRVRVFKILRSREFAFATLHLANGTDDHDLFQDCRGRASLMMQMLDAGSLRRRVQSRQRLPRPGRRERESDLTA